MAERRPRQDDLPRQRQDGASGTAAARRKSGGSAGERSSLSSSLGTPSARSARQLI